MSSSSPMIRCLGCILIMAGALFELSESIGSGMYNETIEITIASSGQCALIQSTTTAILGSYQEQVNTSNHEVEVEQRDGSCSTTSKIKRNAEHVYDVYMVDKETGLADDSKTEDVRQLLCTQCEAVKQTLKLNATLEADFKSISCTGTGKPDCVADVPSSSVPAPSSSIPPPASSDSVVISSSAPIIPISISEAPVSTSNIVVVPVSTSNSTAVPISANSTGISVSMNSTAVSISTGITTTVDVSTIIATSTSTIATATSSIISSMTTTTSSSRPIPVFESSTKTLPPPVTTAPSPSTSKIDAPIPTTSPPAPPTSDAIAATSTSSTHRDTTLLVTTASSPLPTEDATDPSIADTIIVVVPATVLGAVVIISIVVICMMFMVFQFKRIRYEKNDKKKPTNVWIDTRPSLGNQGLVELKSENVRPMRPSRVSFMSKGNVVLQTLSHPLSVDELVFSLQNQNLDKLISEYMNVPSNLVSQNEIPVGAEEKNRYIDVLPNPNTRVPLFLKFGVAHSDYINANYIRGHRNQPKQYIATQGPLEETVIDFWRMVWEQKVTVIIMATELVERNMEKCVQYWPDNGTGFGVTKVYGEIEVTMRKRNKGPSYTVTTFSIAHLERHVTRELTHFWFNGWPDHGVPNSATELVDFLLETRTKREGFTMPGPTLVHCSAGIGRTGVFIATDIGMRQLEENMTVDVLKILATLRQDKGGMVQTKEQYIFIHKALKEYASRVGTVSNLPRFDSDEGRLNAAHNGFYDEEDETVTTFA